MNETSKRAKSIFLDAIEISEERREKFIDSQCADDTSLRDAVDRLLRNHAQMGSFLRSGAAEVPTEDLGNREKTGDRIGPYRLLQQIGEGGFGVVFMAEQEKPVRRRVALKVIKAGMDTRMVIGRFEAERQALAMMDHPNIAKVLDAGATEAGRPFFVMELVKGVPITDYCDEAQLDTHERLKLFQDVCSAVHHAHQKGVIHRDLKPSNIMITLHDARPVVKVIDFGIAKATQQKLTEKTVFTDYGQMIGTPTYMSPEQAVISGLDVDTRSDVYSLGVLLYELLTASPPFDATTLRSAGFDGMRRIIREQEPPKPSTRLSSLAQDKMLFVASKRHTSPAVLAKQVRGDLDWVVMKALEKDRSRRYESASAFREDIQRHLDAEPVNAAAPSRLYQAQKFVQRNRGPLVAASAVGITLLVSLIVSVFLALRAMEADRNAASSLQALRATAPTYITRAEGLFAEQKPDEALAAIEFALELDPHNPDYHLLRANKLQSLSRLPEAIEAYQTLLELRSDDPDGGFNLELTRKAESTRDGSGQLPSDTLAELLQELEMQGRSQDLWPLQRRVGRQAEASRALILKRSRHLHALPAWRDDRVQVLENGMFRVDLRAVPISDLSWLEGLPIQSLDLGYASATDLGPLSTIPLRVLIAPYSDIDDLSDLAELRLEILDLTMTRVADLTPLRGMPLNHLDLDRCKHVTDISIVQRLPLRVLQLAGCDSIEDFQPLAGCDRLEHLSLPVGFRSIDLLKKLPRLERLVLADTTVDVHFSTETPAAEYLAALEARVAHEDRELSELHEVLRELGIPEERVLDTGFTRRGSFGLNLSNFPVSDLGPLKGLPIDNLTLASEGGAIDDLAPLGGMPLRGGLRITGGSFANLEPLRGKSLSNLEVRDNSSLSDIGALADASELRQCFLIGTSVSDLSPLAEHVRLRSVIVEGGSVTDLSPLRDLHELQCLTCSSVPVSDLTPLSELASLEDVRVGYSNVVDLTPLAGLNLHLIYIAGTKVSDLSPLREMVELEHLEAQNTLVHDLSPLSKMKKLRYIDLEHTPIEDISSLRGLNPRVLRIAETRVSDLSPIRNMTDLIDLSISNTVTDLTPIAELESVQILWAAGIRATDVSPLADAPLRELYLDHSAIRDVSPLARSSTLVQLLLPEGAVNVEALRDHPTLQRISFRWQDGVAQTVDEFWTEFDSLKRD